MGSTEQNNKSTHFTMKFLQIRSANFFLYLISFECVSGQMGPVIFPQQSITSYIKVNNQDWPTGSLEEFTICLWVKNYPTSSIAWSGFFSYATQSLFNQIILGAQPVNGGFQFTLNIWEDNLSPRPSIFMSTSVWYHICAEWQSAGGAWSVFKDGIVADSGTGFKDGTPVPIGPTNVVSLILAQDQDSFGGGFVIDDCFVGELDGVSMWDEILSPASVKELFDTCDVPSLAAAQLLTWNEDSLTLFGDAAAQDPSESPCRVIVTTEATPEPKKSIECTQDEIKLALDVLSMSFVSPHAYFDDHSCVGSFNGTHIILTTGLNQCGTKIKFPSSSEITYYNNAWYVDAESDGVIVSRTGEVKILVECTYSRNQTLSVGSFTPNYNLYETFIEGFGEIAFSMSMYKTSDFAEPYAAGDYPIDVDVGQPLYVELSAHSSTPDMELLIAACKASASDNPLDQSLYNYQLIEDGCAVESTVVFIASNSSYSKRFSFEAFVFLDRTSEVFIHCEAVLCSQSDANSCDLDCRDQPHAQRRRRSVSPLDQAERNIITIGPIIKLPNINSNRRAVLGEENSEKNDRKRRFFPAILENKAIK